MPLSKNPLFVGREHDLRALVAALNSSGVTTISQIETAAATGLGGIGKTQIETEQDHILRMHHLVAAFVRDVAAGAVTTTQQTVEVVVFKETAQINQVIPAEPVIISRTRCSATSITSLCVPK